jgi:MFS family permease
VPFLVAPEHALTFLVVALLAFYGLGAVATCAFSSWIRDLVPDEVMGRYFSKRTALAVLVGALLSLGAGWGVDAWTAHFGETRAIEAYSLLFAVAAGVGLVGTWFLARTPEPRMAPAERTSLLKTLAMPFRDRPFRSVLYFLASWHFAVTFVTPFFTVYLLERLGLALVWVIVLAVASQLVHVLFLRVWGRLADRFTNKSVLDASGPMFLLSVLAWPFLTLPETHFLTWPLLVAIHVLGGMASAGVNLSAGNLALKAAPKGRATAYLATNALVSGLAATVAPILGGVAADLLANQELSLTLRWARLAEPLREFNLPAFHLRGLDFLFVIGFVLGLYALHRLLAVKEEGEVEERVVLTSFFQEARLTTLGGAKAVAFFPYTLLRGAARVVGVGRNANRPPRDEEPEAGPGPQDE